MKTNNNKPMGDVMQSSLELLPLIMNNIPQAVFWKDRDLVYLGCNQAFADDAGFSSPEDVVGKTDFDMPWKAQAELYRADDSLVMEKSEPKINYEEPQTTPSGSTIWLSTSKIPVRENGKVVAVLGMYEDITARKQAEKDLLLRDRALSSSLNAVVILNIQDSKPIYVNDAILKMTGYTREEVMQVGLSDITGNPAAPKEIRTAIQNQGFFVGEELIKRKDGSIFPASFFSSLITDDKGQPIAVQSTFFDISERKQAEEAIRQSQARFQTLVETLGEWVWEVDSKGTYTYISPNIKKLLGYEPEEVLGKTPFDLMPPEEAQRVAGVFGPLLSTHQPLVELENTNQHKDGHLVVLETSGVPFFDANGQLLGYRGTDRDVTERKKAEEAVRESEERFRRFTEATIEGLVFHEQGKIIDANPAALAMYGLSDNSEFIGRNLLEFIVPESHKLVLQQMQLETVLPYEIQCFRSDGTTFPVETSTRIYNLGGRTIRASAIRDITARKQAEQKLRENQQLLQLVMDNIPQSVFWKDKNLTYLGVNQAFAEDAGFASPQEIVGRDDFEMPWKEQAELYRADDQRVLEGGEPKLNYEEPQTGPTGQVTWLRTSKVPMRDANGQIFAVLGMYEDISESKRAEQALRDSQQLLQLVMDNIPLSVFWKDAQLNYLGCNRAFAADVALALPGDVVGLTDFDLPSKDRAEHYRADDSFVMQSGNPKLNFEEPQTTPEGTTNWLRTSKIPMRDVDGNVFAMLGLYEDITEQKRLQQSVQDLFERRGYQVQLSTEVSQEIAAATETNDLFDRVVKLTKERFGYYHTQLLRYDSAQDAVVLINGYGEIGQKMLASGHKMPMGEGLIGTAATTGETVMRPTLADDLTWQPNPLLPETKGEIAVPIKWQDNVLGVLDVQSNEAGALAEDDRLLLEGLCGQIAIAMHSAELVEIVRQNEARLAEALKIARLAHWEYDTEKDIFTFNDQFYSLFHTTADQHGGYQLPSAYYAQRFVYPDDLPIVGVEIEKALTSTERHYSHTLEHRIMYAEGGIGYISVNINVDRDENGKITRYYGANQDITERKQVEARLAEALRAARLANWEYDVEKDLFTFNDQFYSIFHTTAEKVGGYQLSSARYAELFVHPDDMEVVGTEIGKALSSTERVYNTSIDHRILYADGGVGYIMVQLTVERDENGKITRYYGANQDITERRKAQEELAERLEEINRLYQNLSHEGWKTYRETADLPSGFVFDQTGVKPVEGLEFATDRFANIPMKVLGGEVVGNLAIADDPQRPISENDLDFLQQVSEQIALALESARLAAQTQSALAQSEKLFESSRVLTQSADLQELTATTVSMLGIPAINRALLTTFNYDAQDNIESLDIAANWWNGTGHEITAVGTHYPYDMIRAMSFFISPTPVFFGDTHTDERVDATTMKLVERLNLRAVAVLPLYTGARQIGALILEAEEPHNFTQEETRLFTALAPQISTMLENRRQFERARQQAEREGLLNIISQKIQSATTVEAVLQIAARELGHALGAPMTIAQLSMKDKK